MHRSLRFIGSLLLFVVLLAGALLPAAAQFVDTFNTRTPAADAQVSVAHFAPFASALPDTSVTVRVNGSDAITNFQFGDITDVNLPAGDYLIEILPTGSATVAISGSVTLEEDTAYTLAAIGDGANQPLELFPFVKETSPAAGFAKLFVGHLSPFANSLPATEVDICTDEGAVVLGNVPYKGFTAPYLQLGAGEYDLKIAVAGSACSVVALDLPSLTLEDGDIVDVFAIGFANSWPLSVASTTGLPITPAQVNVAHFAPFSDTDEGSSVTVKVNGADALSDFRFGDITDPLDFAPGEYLIEIVPTGSLNAAISDTVSLTAGMDYTLAAIGDGANQDLELFALVKDTQPLTNSAKLFIGHLAPFANTLPATEVDICTDSGGIVLNNVAYKAYTDPYLELAPGDYDLKIAVAGSSCNTVALDIPSIRLAAGDIVDVFAIGFVNSWPLSVVSTTGFNLTPDAMVHVAHFSPFANTALGTSVTVRVNGDDTLTNFEFGDIAGPLALESGNYLIEILPTGTNTVAISGSADLEPGTHYLLAAIGDGANQTLELFPLTLDNTPDLNNAKLFVGHLAPFDNDLLEGSTAVDICTDDGAAILSNVFYKDFTNPYLVLPAGDYNLKIALAGSSCNTVALDLPSLRLSAGEIVDVFAIGGANDWPLSIASVNGFDLTPARVMVGHLAPFAPTALGTSVTVRVNGGDALTNFEYGDITAYLDFVPGDYLIEILPTGTNTVAMSTTATLTGGMDYTLAAIGDGSNQVLEIYALVDDNTAPASGFSSLRVVHAAPFAAALDDTRVDICTQDGQLVSGLSNLPYKAVTDPYLQLPAGLYDLKVTAAGSSCASLIFDIPLVLLQDGQVATVFAVGGANGWVPTVLTVPSLSPLQIFLPIISK